MHQNANICKHAEREDHISANAYIYILVYKLLAIVTVFASFNKIPVLFKISVLKMPYIVPA